MRDDDCGYCGHGRWVHKQDSCVVSCYCKGFTKVRHDPYPDARSLTQRDPLPERERVTTQAIEATGDRQVPWASAAMQAVVSVASTQTILTTDDIWSVLDAVGIPRPSEPRAMGAVMRKADRLGYIGITDRTRQSKRKATAEGATHHTGPVRVYVSRLI